MRGLLYKDYIVVKGKMFMAAGIAITILFFILRMVFPGGDGMGMYNSMSVSAMSMGEIHDCILESAVALGCTGLIMLPSVSILMPLLKSDEKNKTNIFIKSMPMNLKTYVASLYIFIGIMYLILTLVGVLWMYIFGISAGDNVWSHMADTMIKCMPSFMGISLFVTSIELPFFIIFGSKKGQMIKVAILIILMWVCLMYLFFGNLDFFLKFDIYKLMIWIQNHKNVISKLSYIIPGICTVFYLISYKITAYLKVKCQEK